MMVLVVDATETLEWFYYVKRWNAVFSNRCMEQFLDKQLDRYATLCVVMCEERNSIVVYTVYIYIYIYIYIYFFTFQHV